MQDTDQYRSDKEPTKDTLYLAPSQLSFGVSFMSIFEKNGSAANRFDFFLYVVFSLISGVPGTTIQWIYDTAESTMWTVSIIYVFLAK